MKTLIIIPVSRASFLKQIFDKLELLDCDPKETGMFLYIDGDLQLFEIAQTCLTNSKFGYKEIKYRRKGLPNVGHILSRRRRIADIHNEIKEIIPTSEFVFLIEDDTLIEPDALQKLFYIFTQAPNVGFVSGVQIGRWGYGHIGAWRYENDTIMSIPKMEGIVQVDAAGLYCCLISTTIYKSHTFEPFDKILGPDFDFGVKLREKGYINYVDFSVMCNHLTKRGSIDFTNTDIVQVGFVKDHNNEWLLQGEV
jgi:hypothetical protein